MLQWMGGSRKKVNVSRKSTLNKQKQYFEQRKRQIQQYGQEDHSDVIKQVHSPEEPRSLDIISLENLATIPHLGYSSLVNPSEPGPLTQKFPTAKAPASLPGTYTCKLEKLKTKVPSSEHTESKELKEDDGSDVFLDLLIDDGEESELKPRSVPENHVAFSVEGLGKIGMETPAHSPKLHKRELPLPPKVSGYAHLPMIFKNPPYDSGAKKNSVLHDVNRRTCGRQAEFSGNSINYVNRTRQKKHMNLDEEYVSPDIFVDPWDYLSRDTGDAYFEGKSRKQKYADSYFSAKKNNMLWESDSFRSVDYPCNFSNPSGSGIWESDLPDMCLPNSRMGKARRIFDNSAQSDPFSSIQLLEKEDDFISFSRKRDKATEFKFDDKSMFHQSSFGSSDSEGSQEHTSLLSEESCSSAAVREERSYDFQLDSAKSRGCKKSRWNETEITMNKMDSDKLFTDEKLWADFMEPFSKTDQKQEVNFNLMSKYSDSKASYYSEGLCTLKSFSPDCFSPIKEDVTSAATASSPALFFDSLRETQSMSSGCKIVPEEDVFNMFSVPKLVPSADFLQVRSKLNSTVDWAPSSSDASTRPSGLSSQMQKFQDGILMPDLPGLATSGTGKNKEYKSPKEPQNYMSSTSPNDLADGNESASEHVGSNNETEELCQGSKAKNDLEEVEHPMALMEVYAKPKSYIDDEKQDHSHSRIASEVSEKELVKQTLGTEGTDIGHKVKGESSGISYQVMLQSYVLQLLSVQKVLL